jgi:hypothetical protein
MNTTPAIPITIEPEAAARIAELGFQDQVERMLDYARQHLPGNKRIEILLNIHYDEDTPDGVSIHVWSDHPWRPEDPIHQELTRWEVENFPPEVLEHLLLRFHLGRNHAG